MGISLDSLSITSAFNSILNFLKSQENLSSTRFIQGTLTNWFPKAVLSRSFIEPESGVILPEASIKKVDFPQPFCPTRLKKHPPGNSAEKCSKTGVGIICFPFSSKSPSKGG